jgi:hypothetical protein
MAAHINILICQRGRGGGRAELGAPSMMVALPVLTGERMAATLTPVGRAAGEPG